MYNFFIFYIIVRLQVLPLIYLFPFIPFTFIILTWLQIVYSFTNLQPFLPIPLKNISIIIVIGSVTFKLVCYKFPFIDSFPVDLKGSLPVPLIVLKLPSVDFIILIKKGHPPRTPIFFHFQSSLHKNYSFGSTGWSPTHPWCHFSSSLHTYT